jgi:surfeit locus 1 family protein
MVERELPQAFELQHPGAPGPEQRIWQNLTREAYASWSGLALQPLLLRQLEPARGEGGPIDDGLIRDWPRPGLDVDKHRGYALQWYGIAATTAILWLWFVVLRPLWARRRAANGGK